jgi:microcystin-dependent protein
MDEPYLGELRVIAFPFAPKGWALCNGQTLPIAQNQALYSLLGTTYGGDGRVTFSLPNLQSRVPVGWGQGPGLTPYNIGQIGGVETVALQLPQLPAHSHTFTGTFPAATEAEVKGPAGQLPAPGTITEYSAGPKNATMAANSIQGPVGPMGGNAPHDNRQPLVAMYYVIALQGIFPPRP